MFEKNAIKEQVDCCSLNEQINRLLASYISHWQFSFYPSHTSAETVRL